jgi:hypothetical protein
MINTFSNVVDLTQFTFVQNTGAQAIAFSNISEKIPRYITILAVASFSAII